MSSLRAVSVCFLPDSQLIKLAWGDLLALKQWFENLAIEETLNKEDQTPAVIGGVFVSKALAGICLQACKDRTDEPEKLMIASKYSDVIQRLLHSCEYEVRSVVLEFFLSQLPSEPNNSLQCEISLDTTCSTTESCSLIGFQTVHFNAQLFTMAIKEEQHVDCLVKVNSNFHLVSFCGLNQECLQYLKQHSPRWGWRGKLQPTPTQRLVFIFFQPHFILQFCR